MYLFFANYNQTINWCITISKLFKILLSYDNTSLPHKVSKH